MIYVRLGAWSCRARRASTGAWPLENNFMVIVNDAACKCKRRGFFHRRYCSHAPCSAPKALSCKFEPAWQARFSYSKRLSPATRLRPLHRLPVIFSHRGVVQAKALDEVGEVLQVFEDFARRSFAKRHASQRAGPYREFSILRDESSSASSAPVRAHSDRRCEPDIAGCRQPPMHVL